MDLMKHLRRTPATPAETPAQRCSGAMTAGHDGTDERVYKIHLTTRTLCGPCADAAGRLGMIDRRETPR